MLLCKRVGIVSLHLINDWEQLKECKHCISDVENVIGSRLEISKYSDFAFHPQWTGNFCLHVNISYRWDRNCHKQLTVFHWCISSELQWLHIQKQELIQKLSLTRQYKIEEELEAPVHLQISYWLPIYFASEDFKIQHLSIYVRTSSILYLLTKGGYWEFTFFICVGFFFSFLKNMN